MLKNVSDNIVEINYHQTGKSTNTNELGMREMQAKVYAKRNSQYLLVKAPPASGKSRALMFVALDKLANQGVKKVIVAVPERSIGKSFKNTELAKYGFYEDWIVDPQYDLTLPGGDMGKVDKLVEFLKSDDPSARIAICTHATLRFAYERIENDHVFDDVMVAIDEFHHVSADDSSVLGQALKNILRNSTAHVFAMTGSYFRGDSAPILTPDDEAMFDKVTYTYYEQLDGYRYLKSFGIDYKFYQGSYLEAIDKALDTTKKTIVHIPNVNSGESTKDKYGEVDAIFDAIGSVVGQDENTGIYTIKDKETGRLLKVADLVTEDGREKVQEYLRTMNSADDLDILIALGMAKEGFDWPFAEQALTIGYRHSLTEVVQIIGRVTRDSSNKSHSQFTNLIEQPDAKNEDVEYAVNQILKAISASLLMEQVLAPQIHLKPRKHEHDPQPSDDDNGGANIYVKGLAEITSDKVRNILENDMNDLQAAILQDSAVKKGIAADIAAEEMNKILIPKVIMTRYPDLTDDEVEQVRQYTVAQINLQHAETDIAVDEQGKTNDFLKMADKFVNIDDLDINLIDSINPFQRAYDVISQNINSDVLRKIQSAIDANKYKFDDQELIFLYPKIKQFVVENGRKPSKDSHDEMEVKLAYALSALKVLRAKREHKMDKPIRSLEDIFADPDAATLLAPDKKPVINHDPDVEGFKEIIDWVKQHGGKEPQKTMDLTERKMFSRLKGIRNNPDRCQKLKEYDELHLLGEADGSSEKEREAKAIKQEKMDFDSLDDILSDDSLLFDDSQEDVELNNKLFDTAKFKQIQSKKFEEEKSVRNKMDGFSKYEPMFKQIQAGISSGQRQLVKFQNPEKNLKEHRFYILNGQLLYIEAIGDLQLRERSHKDARAHVIYENGTENYPFIRGLASSLYGSKQRHAVPGYIVTEPMQKEYKLTNDDYVTGYVYVLKSLSQNPQILEIEKEHDLYKVGFTANTVESRIANAENESTYLYAPVQVVEKIKVINLNAETLEKAIHHALAEYRLDVDIKAANGKLIHPREWFVVDLNTIETVVGKLITQLRVKQLDGMQN